MPGWASCSPGAGGALPAKQQGLLRLCNPMQLCHLHFTHREDVSGAQTHGSALGKVLLGKAPGSGECSGRQGSAGLCISSVTEENFRVLLQLQDIWELKRGIQ